MQKNVVFSLIFAIVIALFAVLNSASVPVRLFFMTVEMSQAVVILVSATIGAVIMYILNIMQILSLRKQIKKLKKEIVTLSPGQAVVATSPDMAYVSPTVDDNQGEALVFEQPSPEKNDY